MSCNFPAFSGGYTTAFCLGPADRDSPSAASIRTFSPKALRQTHSCLSGKPDDQQAPFELKTIFQTKRNPLQMTACGLSRSRPNKNQKKEQRALKDANPVCLKKLRFGLPSRSPRFLCFPRTSNSAMSRESRNAKVFGRVRFFLRAASRAAVAVHTSRRIK